MIRGNRPLKEKKVSFIAKRVYDATSKIPKGRVSTYGAIARAIEREGASRAVGGILRANPWSIRIPCHRVVYADGRIGGFDGNTRSIRKIRLLAREGVRVRDGRILEFEKVFFDDFHFNNDSMNFSTSKGSRSE